MLSRDTHPFCFAPSSSELRDVGPNLSSPGFLGQRLRSPKKTNSNLRMNFKPGVKEVSLSPDLAGGLLLM